MHFKPGDVIVSTSYHYKHSGTRYVVADPPFTRTGKLRTRNKNGNIATFWWPTTYDLPPGFKMEDK